LARDDNAIRAPDRFSESRKMIGLLKGRRGKGAIVVLALALAGVGAWRYFARADQEPAPKKAGDEQRRMESAVPVRVEPVRLADVPVTIDAVGTVQALNTVTARTQVDGQLMQLYFVEGQNVKKGDILAEIDTSIYRAQYNQAVAKKAQDEANLVNARLDLSRYERLVAGNFASKQQYTTQQALVAQLEAQVRGDAASIANAEATLNYATIRSPIDGRVGIRLMDAGNILRATDQAGIVVITQLEPIYVVFTLPQQALPELKKALRSGGAEVRALGPDNASVIEVGRLSVIDNQIDPQTGTVKAKAIFANPDEILWPGEFVNVRIVVETLRQAPVAPSQAIQRGPNGPFVYVVGDDNTATMKPVTTGTQDANLTVITGGAPVGARLVVSGFPSLTSGAKVKVEPAVASAQGRTREKGGARAAREEPRTSAAPTEAKAGEGGK
jgi:membrane fusion protein, multidrug efflux system